MSNQTQDTKDIQTKPTYQEVEQALINVVKAGIYYKKPKEGKFMQSYKERIIKLRQAEDPEEYILKLAITIFPNEEKYHKIKDDYKEFYRRDPKIFTSIMELNKLPYLSAMYTRGISLAHFSTRGIRIGGIYCTNTSMLLIYFTIICPGI